MMRRPTGSEPEPHQEDPIPTEPAIVGQWELTETDATFEGSPTHVALLHTNEIFAYGGSSLDESRLPNPPPAEILDLDTLQTSILSMEPVANDFWCGGHTFLEDGRLLIAGGTLYYPRWANLFGGLKSSYIFNPVDRSWVRSSDMHLGRWYPTLIRLSDNSVMAVAGLKDRFPEFWVRVHESFRVDQGWKPMDRKKNCSPCIPAYTSFRMGMYSTPGSSTRIFTFPGPSPRRCGSEQADPGSLGAAAILRSGGRKGSRCCLRFARRTTDPRSWSPAVVSITAIECCLISFSKSAQRGLSPDFPTPRR